MSNINIATVLKRLEAVTSRLEDLYDHTGNGASQPSNVSTSTSTVTTVSTFPLPPPAPVQAQLIEDPPSVTAYDEQILKGKVQPFVKLAEKFAIASVVEQATLVERLYTNLGGIIRTAAICKKPEQAAFAELLHGLQDDIGAISAIKDANWKERDWVNHLSFVAEGSPAAAWIAVESKPGPYVTDMKEATQFYGNRIIKDYKEKDKAHVEWVRAYTAIFDDLKKYVMEYHTTGLVWNAKGISISEYKASEAAAGGAPPPPPPVPPPPPPTLPPASASATGDVTKNLRKVDKSEMTHKNPALRASSIVPSTVVSTTASKKPIRPAKPQALMGKKPPKFALEGNKWAVEYQENEGALTVKNTEISHIINLFGCKSSTVVIKGKVNAVTIAPTVQVDSTDSGQIYLSKDCLSTEVTTAKCSSINISLPVEGEEDGMLLTKIKDGKLVTTVVEHVG
ncbi:adenylate cyclase associated N terminal-domain-containing protein [Lactarius vividus]|nr:adenylate cyclase associated N terminal-domain-containing protein [Lactarius vividus]